MIPLGNEAKSWVCKRTNKGGIGLGHWAQLTWQSVWFERNWEIQKRYAERFPLLTDPVFVVGLWRSATTYLHSLLSDLPSLLAPQTWQCMAPSTFALLGRPRHSKQIKRPMDQHIIGTETAQEDEFALMALGIPSAYLGFFRPDRLPDLRTVVDPEYWELQHGDRWYEEWICFLEMIENKGGRRLLLKSPGHLFRLPSLALRFPKSKWIYVYREAQHCLRSNRKMWAAMFDEYAISRGSVESLDEFLEVACLGAINSLDWMAEHMRKDSFIGISFDELVRAPAAVIERIENFLRGRDQAGFNCRNLHITDDVSTDACGQGEKICVSDRLYEISQLLNVKHETLFTQGIFNV